jgi:hypothetical protein
MSEFTITGVSPEPRIWKGEHGTFHIWEVMFRGPQGEGTADHKRKASSPAPQAGETFDGEIVHKGEHKPELKRIWKSESQTQGKKGALSVSERASINRSVAQKNAILLLGIEVQGGLTFKDKTADDLLKTRIDWLFQDLQQAGDVS